MAIPDGNKLTPFIKDPDATLDYAIPWEEILDGDPVETSDWEVLDDEEQTLVIETDPPNEPVIATPGTTVWLSGGTLNKRYGVHNRITTIGGRTDDRTIYVKIKQR